VVFSTRLILPYAIYGVGPHSDTLAQAKALHPVRQRSRFAYDRSFGMPDADDTGRDARRRLEALTRANEIRIERAHLKKEIRSGKVSVARVIADPPAFVASARVFDLMLAAPKVTRSRAERLLDECGIPPSQTVGGLAEPRRRALVALLSDGCDDAPPPVGVREPRRPRPPHYDGTIALPFREAPQAP
jgi:hypothetical protein